MAAIACPWRTALPRLAAALASSVVVATAGLMFATATTAQTASVKPAAKPVATPATKTAKPRTKPAARKVAPVPVLISLA